MAFDGWRGFRGWNQDDRDLTMMNLSAGAQRRECTRRGYGIQGKPIPDDLAECAEQDTAILRQFASGLPAPPEFFTQDMIRRAWAPAVEPRVVPTPIAAQTASGETMNTGVTGVTAASSASGSFAPSTAADPMLQLNSARASPTIDPLKAWDTARLANDPKYRIALEVLRNAGETNIPDNPNIVIDRYRQTFPREVRDAWAAVDGAVWPTGQALNAHGQADAEYQRKKIEYDELLQNPPFWAQLPPLANDFFDAAKRSPIGRALEFAYEVGSPVAQDHMDQSRETYEEAVNRTAAELARLDDIRNRALEERNNALRAYQRLRQTYREIAAAAGIDPLWH